MLFRSVCVLCKYSIYLLLSGIKSADKDELALIASPPIADSTFYVGEFRLLSTLFSLVGPRVCSSAGGVYASDGNPYTHTPHTHTTHNTYSIQNIRCDRLYDIRTPVSVMSVTSLALTSSVCLSPSLAFSLSPSLSLSRYICFLGRGLLWSIQPPVLRPDH